MLALGKVFGQHIPGRGFVKCDLLGRNCHIINIDIQDGILIGCTVTQAGNQIGLGSGTVKTEAEAAQRIIKILRPCSFAEKGSAIPLDKGIKIRGAGKNTGTLRQYRFSFLLGRHRCALLGFGFTVFIGRLLRPA